MSEAKPMILKEFMVRHRLRQRYGRCKDGTDHEWEQNFVSLDFLCRKGCGVKVGHIQMQELVHGAKRPEPQEPKVIRRNEVDIVFDGPPGKDGPHGPRLVEVEVAGRGVKLGEWIEREDGLWVLRFSAADVITATERP